MWLCAALIYFWLEWVSSHPPLPTFLRPSFTLPSLILSLPCLCLYAFPFSLFSFSCFCHLFLYFCFFLFSHFSSLLISSSLLLISLPVFLFLASPSVNFSLFLFFTYTLFSLLASPSVLLYSSFLLVYVHSSSLILRIFSSSFPPFFFPSHSFLIHPLILFFFSVHSTAITSPSIQPLPFSLHPFSSSLHYLIFLSVTYFSSFFLFPLIHFFSLLSPSFPFLSIHILNLSFHHLHFNPP